MRVDPARIVLDPGIGFGKTVAQNFALLARQHELLAAGCPLLVGWSRKSSLGAVTGIEAAGERMVPSMAAALLAAERGARYRAGARCARDGGGAGRVARHEDAEQQATGASNT